MDERELLSATVYATAYSPCGKYLAAGNNFGYISLFDMEKALSQTSTKWRKAIFTFKATQGSIYTMVTTNKLMLITGGTSAITAWKWSEILERKPAIHWTIDENRSRGEGALSNEMNYMVSDNKKIYTGGDDKTVYSWDLATRKCDAKLKGHDEFIHCLALLPHSNSVVSASEDGCVKVWDLRSGQAVQTFKPHESKELSRPHFGKWISCVAVDENGHWMACGGGPNTSLWHLRSQSQTAVLESPDFTAFSIMFHNDVILAGGNGHALRHWSTNGEQKATVPSTIGTVFSLTSNPERSREQPPLIAGGTSYKLDVFCNLNYRSHILSL